MVDSGYDAAHPERNAIAGVIEELFFTAYTLQEVMEILLLDGNLSSPKIQKVRSYLDGLLAQHEGRSTGSRRIVPVTRITDFYPRLRKSLPLLDPEELGRMGREQRALVTTVMSQAKGAIIEEYEALRSS